MSSRACENCGADIDSGYPCPECGYDPGDGTSVSAGPERTDAVYRARTLVYGEEPTRASMLFVTTTIIALVATVAVFFTTPEFALLPLGGFLFLIAIGWVTYQAETARLVTLVATVVTVGIVLFITGFLFAEALPAFREHGLELLTLPKEDGEVRWFFFLEGILPASDSAFNPAGGNFSLIAQIWATIVVTIIAGSVAGPLGLLGALFISEIASARLRAVIKPGVEILAGIPSIVYGFIGFTILNNFVQDAFLDQGASFLIAGIVVGVMALPTVVSVAEDALSAVPDSMGDGSVAVGATKWQTIKSISIPAAFSGISAAVILGLGRAIGETMAVAAILAAGVGLADPLFDPLASSATLTGFIATSYGSASESLLEVLFVAGVMLFTIVAGMSVVSQYIEKRVRSNLQGEA
jgi:phosphate transport system permease protein